MKSQLRRALAGAVLITFTAAGCGIGDKVGGDQPPATSDGKGEITGNLTVAWWGGDSRNKKTNTVIELFEAQHAGVTTERQSADYGNYFDRLNVQASSGSLPCAVQMQGRQLNDYTKRKVLLPLDEMIAAGTIDTSKIPPAVLAAGKGTDGKVYFIPYGAAYDAIAINTTIAERAGLAALPENYTWPQFLDYVRRAKAALGDDTYVLGDLGGTINAFNAWTLGQGLELFNAEGKIGITKEQLTEYWTMWKQLRDEGVTIPPQVAAEEPVGSDQGYVATGKLMINGIPGNALFNAQQTLTGHDAGELMTFRYPDGSAGIGNAVIPSGFGIAANCANVPTAAAFIDFFTNDAEAGKSFASDNGAATNQQVLEEQLNDPELPALKKHELELYQQIVADEPPYIVYPPGYNATFQQSFERNWDEIAFGRLSIQQAVDAFFTETNATLG
ncbi:ABC transporter substrate-binding protein [Microlunatus speluncae]|uniref:ABC transporter substrate-binding protein n=1 Tax=Microlunatus speluncae TaxID=2594267 RepID=UPI0013754C9A|nr:ABC transporter substrate-binding protein [Microlunatus speluncae]